MWHGCCRLRCLNCRFVIRDYARTVSRFWNHKLRVIPEYTSWYTTDTPANGVKQSFRFRTMILMILLFYSLRYSNWYSDFRCLLHCSTISAYAVATVLYKFVFQSDFSYRCAFVHQGFYLYIVTLSKHWLAWLNFSVRGAVNCLNVYAAFYSAFRIAVSPQL